LKKQSKKVLKKKIIKLTNKKDNYENKRSKILSKIKKIQKKKEESKVPEHNLDL